MRIMKRFFLIPALVLLILAVGCTCSVSGSATMPTTNPAATASPTAKTTPVVTPEPTATTAPETVAPVEPTEPVQSMMPDASPSAGATAGN